MSFTGPMLFFHRSGRTILLTVHHLTICLLVSSHLRRTWLISCPADFSLALRTLGLLRVLNL